MRSANAATSDGDLAWVQVIDGYYSFANSVVLDEENHALYVTGQFQGDSDNPAVDFGFGTQLIGRGADGTAGARNGFVVRYALDSNNDLSDIEWIQQIQTADAPFYAVLGDGGLYVAGSTGASDTIVGDKEKIHDTTFTVAMKMDPSNGAVQWLWATYGGGRAEIHSLAYDAGKVVIGGRFHTWYYNQHGVIFGQDGPEIRGEGPWWGFVVQVDAKSGETDWVQAFGHDPGGDVSVDGVARDQNGNTYATGTFYKDATFGNETLTSAGENDMFLTRLDDDGTVAWTGQIGGQDIDYPNDIFFDFDDMNKKNTLYVAGTFHGLLDLDPGVGVALPWSFSDGPHGVLLKMDASDLANGPTRAWTYGDPPDVQPIQPLVSSKAIINAFTLTDSRTLQGVGSFLNDIELPSGIVISNLTADTVDNFVERFTPPEENHNPTGVADAYAVGKSQIITVPKLEGLLHNDYDLDHDSLSVTQIDTQVLSVNSDGSFTYRSPDTEGTYRYDYTVTDNRGGSATATVTFTVGTGIVMDKGIVTGVTNTDWTTVTLDHDYGTQMVVIATPNYDQNHVPVVTRIRHAQGNSFEVMLQRTDDSTDPVPAVAIHYLVLREGVYTTSSNGVKMEAVKFSTADVADYKYDNYKSWVGIERQYLQTYTSPVVVGQVMTYTPHEIYEPDWSVFWSSNGSRTNPPSSTSLYVGLHTGENVPDIWFEPETIGYVVFEATSNGSLDGVPFVAALGSDTVKGITNGAPYSYTYSLPQNSTYAAVASQAGMDGGNGGWAVLYGNNPVTNSQINLAIDEDQSKDAERSHTTEQVAYVVFDPPAESAADVRDTNQDGNITPLDALLVINYLNSGSDTSVWSSEWQPLDVNQDGRITPLDSLIVINYLNVGGPAEGEVHAPDFAGRTTAAQAEATVRALDRLFATMDQDDDALTDLLVPDPLLDLLV